MSDSSYLCFAFAFDTQIMFFIFTSFVPLLLSVWTIDLAFLCFVFYHLLFFCSFVMCFFFCLFVHVGVRELTLLFSHLQRQRNTKKVLHNSHHTLLSGLRPYSSPYLSGDRYALRHLLQPHSASWQAAKVYLQSCKHKLRNNTFSRCRHTPKHPDCLLPELSAWMCCLSNSRSLM